MQDADRSEAITAYLAAMRGQALVNVQLLQDGFVTTLALDDVPCADFAVASDALAWAAVGGGRPHGVYAQHVHRQDDDLWIWHLQESDGMGWLVHLSPAWTPEQLAALTWWAGNRRQSADVTQAQLAEHCAMVAADAANAGVASAPDLTYIVAGVDRAPKQTDGVAGQDMITVGALVVAADSSELVFVGLPGVADGGLGNEFAAQAQQAAQAGTNWVDWFNWRVATGNGYTTDYSAPETMRAPTAVRAGYRWLRNRMGEVGAGVAMPTRAPGPVVRR